MCPMSNITVIDISCKGDYRKERERVEAYLYDNFSVVAAETNDIIRVVGVGNGGFSAEAMIERLASGLIFGEVREIPVTEDLRTMILFGSVVSMSDAS